MTRVYVRGYARADQVGADGPIPIVAANEGRMDDGIDLRMDRADLTRYQANPVIMYGHEYFGRDSLPIGRADNIRTDGPQLLADATFDRGDPFAAEVDRKYRDGFLSAFSIGFDARGIDRDGVPDVWELFEISSVPLPMDPAALADLGRGHALARALRDGAVSRDAVAALLGQDVGWVGLRGPIRAHSTPTVDTPWDGPAAVAAAPNDAEVLRYMHAWVDDDGDPDAKASYSFPHHAPETDTPANLPAVRNGLARLGQADIPEADRAGVEAHLRRHLEDGDGDDEGRAAPRLAVARRRLQLLGA